MSSSGRHESERFDNLVSMSKAYANHGKSGRLLSYSVDLSMPLLDLSRTLTSREISLLQCKVDDVLKAWSKKYEKYLADQHRASRARSAEELNREAVETTESLTGLLHKTLDVDDAVDWDSAQRRDEFSIDPSELASAAAIPPYLDFDDGGRPVRCSHIEPPQEPSLDAFLLKKPFLDRLFSKKRLMKEFALRRMEWGEENRRLEAVNAERDVELEGLVRRFEELKSAFEVEKDRYNKALLEMRSRYLRFDGKAIEEYCDLVLSSSEYPDFMPTRWALEYRSEARTLVVDYWLPSSDRLPDVEAYRYVKTRDAIEPKTRSATAQRQLYESVLYQVVIRTLHELFESDRVDALDVVTFNGIVTSTNPATGIRETKTIMSVASKKSEFEAFDLERVEPAATFKHLKGVAASRLVDLAPVAPIMNLDKTDRRIVQGRSIAAGLDERTNLAAMDWEDFEHLVRELFEKEFIASGGEVHVTQGSRDGGVDAIAFDPDPIRGGKLVIQAKRYTNTVEVAAVRDLYGTLLNEGATKGILVTTSDFGSDAYAFAKDKPITLLNGANLLSLLEKHGRSMHVDIQAARSQK